MASRDTADVKDSGLYVCERTNGGLFFAQLKNNACARTSFWIRKKAISCFLRVTWALILQDTRTFFAEKLSTGQ